LLINPNVDISTKDCRALRLRNPFFYHVPIITPKRRRTSEKAPRSIRRHHSPGRKHAERHKQKRKTAILVIISAILLIGISN